MMGITLRYPYEVRKQSDYFEDIKDEKVPKDMLDLALHIVGTKRGDFESEKFEDQYEDALKELLSKKAERREDRAPTRARSIECCQPDGCVAREHQSRERKRAAEAPAHGTSPRN